MIKCKFSLLLVLERREMKWCIQEQNYFWNLILKLKSWMKQT